jgi:hypothetical protein
LSQLSHISQEILKHNNIAMCCHTIYTGKKVSFSHYCKQKMRSSKNITSTSQTRWTLLTKSKQNQVLMGIMSAINSVYILNTHWFAWCGHFSYIESKLTIHCVMDIFCDKSGVVQIKSRQPSRYYLRNWFQSQT